MTIKVFIPAPVGTQWFFSRICKIIPL